MDGERPVGDAQRARFNDDRQAGKGAAISDDLEEKFGQSTLRAMKTLEQGRVGQEGEVPTVGCDQQQRGLVGWAASMEKKLSKV